MIDVVLGRRCVPPPSRATDEVRDCCRVDSFESNDTWGYNWLIIRSPFRQSRWKDSTRSSRAGEKLKAHDEDEKKFCPSGQRDKGAATIFHNRLKAAPHWGGVFEFLHTLSLVILQSLICYLHPSFKQRSSPIRKIIDVLCDVPCYVVLPWFWTHSDCEAVIAQLDRKKGKGKRRLKSEDLRCYLVLPSSNIETSHRWFLTVMSIDSLRLRWPCSDSHHGSVLFCISYLAFTLHCLALFCFTLLCFALLGLAWLGFAIEMHVSENRAQQKWGGKDIIQ